MPAPTAILALIDRFNDDPRRFRGAAFNETEARVHFINPFFEALGWEMDDRSGRGEVKHEDRVSVMGKAKAPDYGFYLDRRLRFFAEAKKPGVDLSRRPEPAYQLRRYAWTAKLPLSILTDFEEFAVYDARVRPRQGDAPTVARLRYWRYDQYPDAWDEIAATFGRDAVLAGSLEPFAERAGGKKGIAAVDAEFLRQLDAWRDTLARAIANRNPRLGQRDLNFAVQQTLDRIIFLRIAEDRGSEPYGQLRGLTEGAGTFDRLLRQFFAAEDRYNSGLFHLRHRGRNDQPDLVTPALTLDDKPLKEIIRALYEPISPYEFSVFPADILGQVYEQFLGKVIRLTPGGHAKVEEKPEVRKAGGVYYTPTYIVDYIVRQTLGRLVAGHAPDPAGPVSRLRVLDPACGSGSFLLGAYQFLLDWHLDGYRQDAKKWARKRGGTLVQTADGGYALTLAERKRILLDNLYGVDIDTQAVEVTKLSLLLKLMEGAAAQLGPQQALLGERLLPDLDGNVQCGNSLIGPDFYEHHTRDLTGLLRPVRSGPPLTDDDILRVNPFDWRAAFPEIMRAGGFDVVIGNPPYIRIQAMKEWAPLEVELYKQLYRAAGKGNYDIYVVFVEKALSLLNERGRLGFILPHKFFNAKYGEPLRGLIAEGRNLSEVVHFGAQQVFSGATTYTCLLFLERYPQESFEFEKVTDLEAWKSGATLQRDSVPASAVTASEWNFVVGEAAELFRRLSDLATQLGEVVDVFVGLQTSADDVFILDYVKSDSDTMTLRSKALGIEWDFEPNLLFPIVSGTDVNRYKPLPERQFVLFPYDLSDKTVKLIDLPALARRYPKTAEYLMKNRKRLESREKGKLKGKGWHGYIYLKNMQRQAIQKLCVPRLVEYLYAAYDVEGIHFLDNVDVGGLVWKSGFAHHDLRYLLGLLNSRLLRWYFPQVSAPFRGGWLSANRQFIEQLPIHLIDPTNPTDLAQHDHLVTLVQKMLDLHQRQAAERNPQVRTAVQRQIDATDKQIDRVVYGLYGLTEEEIAIIEG